MVQPRKTSNGWSSMELLVVVTIVATVTTYSLSSFQSVLDSTRGSHTVNELIGAFHYARAAAVDHRQYVTVCPLDEAGACHSDWESGVSIFLDPHNARELQSQKHLLRRLDPIKQGSLRVAIGANRNYFQFKPSGFSNGTWGNLTYCRRDDASAPAVHFIMSQGGRLRRAADRNGDGTPEKSNGQAVTCPAS